jgi:hypothetical protein
MPNGPYPAVTGFVVFPQPETGFDHLSQLSVPSGAQGIKREELSDDIHPSLHMAFVEYGINYCVRCRIT